MRTAVEYSPEIAEEVCVHLASGLSLRAIQELEGMPEKSMVIRWTFRHPEFEKLYNLARKIQAELLADEIIEISDGSAGDTVVDDKGGVRISYENVQRSRLRVDSRKWYCTKLLPKFAEKVTQEHTGPHGAPLVTPVINLTMEGCAPTDPSTNQLEAALATGASTNDEGN